MPVCKNCGANFPNHLKINGKWHNLQSRKFCLVCSPFGEHNTKDITEIIPVPEGTKFCKGCNTIKPATEFYRNGKKYYSLCKECANAQSVETQRDRKRQCLEYKGGKCLICGYDKCPGSLVFHHLDPAQKDFRISRWATNSFDKAKKELDKCVLLCSNCHGEVHAGITKLPED